MPQGTCVCTNRVYVQEAVYEQFLAKVAPKVAQLTVGNGFDSRTDIGPLIDCDGYNKVTAQVADVLDKGARCTVGGKRIEQTSEAAYFFAPTLLADMTSEMRIMSEETFGPVAPVQQFYRHHLAA